MRPNKIADLDKYQTSAVNLVTVSPEVLDMHPGAAAKIYSAFAEIMEEDYDFRVVVENGSLVRGKTQRELNDALTSAQRVWDRGKEGYERFLNDGEWPKYDYEMRAYCTAEGIDFPEKPAG